MTEDSLLTKDRLKRIEDRLNLNDQFRHELRDKQEGMRLQQAIINTQLDNISKDIEELSKRITNIDSRVEARLTSINKALWAGFTVFLTAFLTVLGFIIAQGGSP